MFTNGQAVRVLTGKLAGRIGTVCLTEPGDIVVTVELREQVTQTVQRFMFYPEQLERDDLRLPCSVGE